MRMRGHRFATCALFVLVSFCLGFFASRVDAEEPDVVITNFDVHQGRVAFTLERSNQKDIWVIDFEKIEAKPLIASPAADEHPRWSPDGTKIIFDSDRSGKKEIYRANWDGTQVQKLAASPTAGENADWSPDGNRVAFQSSRSAKPGIYLINADGSKAEAITHSTKQNIAPRWSPRGTEIIFATDSNWPGWDIAIYDLIAGKQQLLTKGYLSYWQPCWSPNGAAFAFAYGSGASYDIWMQEKGAAEQKALIVRPGRDLDPEWTDDENTLFFVGEKTPGKEDYELFLYRRSTNEYYQITHSRGKIRHPSWTPFRALDSIAEELKAQPDKDSDKKGK